MILFTGRPIYGIKFARAINAELIVLHTFNVEVGDDITQEKYNNLKKLHWIETYNALSKINEYFLEKHVKTDTDLNIKFDYRFLNSVFVEEIRNIAQDDEVVLIESHILSGIRFQILESVPF
jgi:hypothetical protein